MIPSSPQEQPDAPQDGPVRIGNLVLGLVRLLVDHPELLEINTETEDAGTTLRLYVAADDIGKVIGKQGRTARSLRTVLSAIGSKTGHRYTLDVLEQE